MHDYIHTSLLVINMSPSLLSALVLVIRALRSDAVLWEARLMGTYIYAYVV